MKNNGVEFRERQTQTAPAGTYGWRGAWGMVQMDEGTFIDQTKWKSACAVAAAAAAKEEEE